ncbi:hypothetical protein MWU38_04365 [Qipengyuania sp. S6317L1]|uniref:hypothetical protein n=1 Tax=Qipengyuania sp. S6317L1 TaxID=2926410 RepID=UPI001FF0F9C3|nr:hypothetical protein [Qipengyuania sp. S6317L1]MCK0098605.1 hypothetical protein [Qipengyuania sp. S6317L1]
MKKLGVLISLPLLASCANMNLGEVEMRRAAPPPSLSADENPAEAGCRGDWDPSANASASECNLLLEAKLLRQNPGYGRPILDGDVYSIRLDHAMIADLSEIKLSLPLISRGQIPFRAVGEIVILANVFEFSDTSAGAPAFADAMDVSTAKVIYFSEDVEEEQDLNFNNIVLQAPEVYGGNPVGVQLIVLELDRTSGPATALLETLARLGEASNAVPNFGADNTLLQLGATLLSNSHDDTIFEYRFVLDPGTANVDGEATPFEEGRYVLGRNERRRTEFRWEDLRLDHNTGKLYEWIGGQPQAFIGETYMTLSVVKHPPGTTASYYAMRDFSTFQQELETALDARDAPLSEVTGRVEGIIRRTQSGALGASLARDWEAVVTRARLAVSIPESSPDPTKCSILPTTIESREVTQFQAFQRAMQFVSDFAEARGQKIQIEGETSDLFEVRRQSDTMTLLGSYFAPFSSSTVPIIPRETLLTSEEFMTKFEDKSDEFAANVLSEAEREFTASSGSPVTCDQLIERGLAAPVT